MTYISIQSVKSAFVKVLEILNLQVSVKGQTPGSHCYNQPFELVYFYSKRRSHSRFLHMVFTSISWHFLPDCSLFSLSKCEFFLGWELMCSTAPSLQTIWVWSYKIKGKHLVMKGPLSNTCISPICANWSSFLMGMQGVVYSLGYNIKWYISWVLAMEITHFMIWLLGVWASHSLSKHCWHFIELKSCLDKYRSPV